MMRAATAIYVPRLYGLPRRLAGPATLDDSVAGPSYCETHPNDPNCVSVDQLRKNPPPNNLGPAPFDVTGDKTYIDPNSPEGQAITESFAARNRIPGVPIGGPGDPYYIPQGDGPFVGPATGQSTTGKTAGQQSSQTVAATPWWIWLGLALGLGWLVFE